MAERNPIDIMGRAIQPNRGRGCATGSLETCPDDSIGPCFCKEEAREYVRALEAEGFCIVDTENVTETMLRAGFRKLHTDSVENDFENSVRAALLAAPKYGDANENKEAQTRF